MILLASLMAMAAPVAASPDEIVVTAEKLRRLRLSVATDDRGQVDRCDVTTSSGDTGIDQKACDATRECVASGVAGGGAVADCVDRRLIAFVQARGGG